MHTKAIPEYPKHSHITNWQILRNILGITVDSRFFAINDDE